MRWNVGLFFNYQIKFARWFKKNPTLRQTLYDKTYVLACEEEII